MNMFLTWEPLDHRFVCQSSHRKTLPPCNGPTPVPQDWAQNDPVTQDIPQLQVVCDSGGRAVTSEQPDT